MRFSSPSTAKGFTLLELLLSLSLSALLLTTLSIGTRSAVQDWEQQNHKLEQQVDTALGILQIEQALRSAYPHRYKNRKENRNLHFFEGSETRLHWISHFSPGPKQGLTTWAIESTLNEDGQSNIMVAISPTYPINPDLLLNTQKTGRFTLAKNSKISIEYLEERPNTPPSWINHWSARERNLLPSAVRITFQNTEETSTQQEWRLLSIIPVTRLHLTHPKSRIARPVFK